jgi:hypothetical protein
MLDPSDRLVPFEITVCGTGELGTISSSEAEVVLGERNGEWLADESLSVTSG